MIFSLSNACSIIFMPLTSSVSSLIWKIIYFLWSWYGVWILAGLILWVMVELITRNGTLHYNSDNGFSPSFNVFIGSGLNLGIQSTLLILLEKIFGESVYCFIWPYPVHAIIFIMTGLFLYATGFWPYLKWLGITKSNRRYRRH